MSMDSPSSSGASRDSSATISLMVATRRAVRQARYSRAPSLPRLSSAKVPMSPPSSPAGGGPHEVGEQRPHGRLGSGQFLRVPLHADEVAAGRALDGLDEPVGGEGDRDQVGGQALDPLVVHAVDRQ